MLTPDLLGYAEHTPWPAGAPLSLDDEVEHLAPLITAQAGRIHLLGHSYGGAVALQIALRWPDRIKSLTLYEPVRFRLLLDSPAMTPLAYEVIRLARSVQRMAGPAPADAAARFVDYWSGDGAWAKTSPARQQAARAAHAEGRRRVHRGPRGRRAGRRLRAPADAGPAARRRPLAGAGAA